MSTARVTITETVENRISKKHIVSTGIENLSEIARILCRAERARGTEEGAELLIAKGEREKSASGAKRALQGTGTRRTATRQREQRDDAYTIETRHLHYRGNGVYATHDPHSGSSIAG